MLSAVVAHKPPPGGSQGCNRKEDSALLTSLLNNLGVNNIYRATDASCVGLGFFCFGWLGFFPPTFLYKANPNPLLSLKETWLWDTAIEEVSPVSPVRRRLLGSLHLSWATNETTPNFWYLLFSGVGALVMHRWHVQVFIRYPEQCGLNFLPGQNLAETHFPTADSGLGAV